MNTNTFVISFLATEGRGRWRRACAQARSRFHEMVTAARARRHLAEMDGRMLRDIGISPADAQAEAGRRPWDLGPPQR